LGYDNFVHMLSNILHCVLKRRILSWFIKW